MTLQVRDLALHWRQIYNQLLLFRCNNEVVLQRVVIQCSHLFGKPRTFALSEEHCCAVAQLHVRQMHAQTSVGAGAKSRVRSSSVFWKVAEVTTGIETGWALVVDGDSRER